MIGERRLLGRRTISSTQGHYQIQSHVNKPSSNALQSRINLRRGTIRPEVSHKKTNAAGETGASNFDNIVTTSTEDSRLKNYLRKLEKVSTNNAGAVVSSGETDGSQSLSVFSLSSNETEEKKSTPVKKRVSYLKTSTVDVGKSEQVTPSTITARNSRFSDALLKAQQFNDKYKKAKPAPTTREVLNVVEDRKYVDEDKMSSSISPEESSEISVAKKKSSTSSSSSSEASTIKSLMNVKDLLLDLPSTSPESQPEKAESVVESEKYESDFEEIPTEHLPSSSSRSDISNGEVESESVMKDTFKTEAEVSEEVTGSSLTTGERPLESSVRYSSDFQTSADVETTPESESDTLVSLPKTTLKPATKFRNVKTSTAGREKFTRGTQTAAETNLSNFYRHFDSYLPSFSRPYVYIVDSHFVSNSASAPDGFPALSLNGVDMLKLQLMQLRSTIESQRRNYVTTVSALKPDYRYTTWEDTRKLIENGLKRRKKAAPVLQNNG